MGFFPGESLVRPPGWLRKAEGGATLIPCPSGFGRLDIFSRFTTGTKRLYVERGCRLGGREAGSGPRILAQDHLLSRNLGGLLQGCRTQDKGILYSLEQVKGSCREGWLPPTISRAHRPMAASICVNPSLGCVVRACLSVSSLSLPEVVLLGLLRRLVATAARPLALLPGGGFGRTWGPTSRALPIHYMAFLSAGRGWRWRWGPGVELAKGPMSSFCRQEVEKAIKVSAINCLLPHPLNPDHRFMIENLEFPNVRF